MQKRMKIMLLFVGIIFGSIFLWKVISGFMLKRYMATHIRIPTVSAETVKLSPWDPTLKATGSLRAIKGVNVTTELAGMVQKIYFKPGTIANENELLVQLNADTEIGQLQSLKAQAALAEITYKRDLLQYKAEAVSKQTIDTDLQNWKSLLGQVAEQTATVEKKTIRAPFRGRLGINNINPGQYINPGEKIVSLQTLNPLYVDFYVPQQELHRLTMQQTVSITSDAFPRKRYTGKITTIDPALDVTTRNVTVEATIDNPLEELTPGMFANVTVSTGKPLPYLTLPQTAISFNSYGNIVYVLDKTTKKDDNNQTIYKAKQVFVVTGETRGNQITVIKGLKNGDLVVTSGQLKLKNDSQVIINNTDAPKSSMNQATPNEH